VPLPSPDSIAVVTTLSHLFMHVSSLERSRRFYVDLLGLSVLLEEPGYLRVGGADGFHIGLEERGPGQVGAAGIEIVIRVDDVDTTYARLAEQVPFESGPADQPWGARHVWLHDPDGYRLSLYS
jgi:catechol 2,3-dioxygenase-like lactoylglutathione lyase family enzyme